MKAKTIRNAGLLLGLAGVAGGVLLSGCGPMYARKEEGAATSSAQAPIRATSGFAPIGVTQESLDLLSESGSSATASALNLASGSTPVLGDIPLVGEALRGRAEPHFVTHSSDLPDDEIWVITRPTFESAQPAMQRSDDVPGCGSMICLSGIPILSDAFEEENPDRFVALPLAHTDVDATITGYIASVTVNQQFQNPYDGKIEAAYVFPLPQNAAVSGFVMTIGERRIRGIIREREEAERIYREARRQGYNAALLTQERPNIFTQRVANIEPGKAIDVDITYYNTLAYTDGWYEFVFPMVVGPRFNPPDTSDGVGAVSLGSDGASGQQTEVRYLRPNERSGHDISLELTIDAGVPIEELECRSHVVRTSHPSSTQTYITLSPHDRIPNKDFVLRYRVAGEQLRASLVTHRDERGGFFTLMVYPPHETRDAERAPIELVFVIDCSGSMSGEPIATAKHAMKRAIRHIRPDDTFQIIRFSNDASTFGDRPMRASERNVADAIRYVDSLKAGGGTMMNTAVREALAFPTDPERVRYVVFMTDGFIGNETEVLGEIQDRLNGSRIFSFGIGSSPNRYLLERMAKIGRGVLGFVGLNDDPTAVIDLFVDRISHPAMTNVSIDWGGLAVDDVYPQRLPDLYVGRPVILTGRFRNAGMPNEAEVRITGRAGSRRIEVPVSFSIDEMNDPGRALPSIWARMKIAALADRATHDEARQLPQRIRAIALEYGLMSAYTAFVAVDSSHRTAGDHGTIVPVGVPVPEGVKYETTVSEGRGG